MDTETELLWNRNSAVKIRDLDLRGQRSVLFYFNNVLWPLVLVGSTFNNNSTTISARTTIFGNIL